MQVLLTRAESDGDETAHLLEKAGFEVVHIPLIERRYHPDAVSEAAGEPHDGWVLTSPSAVRAMTLAGVSPAAAWLACVGPATSRAVREAGWTVALQPEVFTASALVAALGSVDGRRVIYPKADLASDEVAAGLRAAGAEVTEVVAYDNAPPPGSAEAIRRRWPIASVVLFSGSAARRLAEAVPPPWSATVRVVAIGPSTANAARAAGLPVHAIARPHTVGGVVATLRRLTR